MPLKEKFGEKNKLGFNALFQKRITQGNLADSPDARILS
jgi:hypothetical protein